MIAGTVEGSNMSRQWLRSLACVTVGLASPRVAAQVIGLPLTYHTVMRGVGAALDAGADQYGLRAIGFTGIAAVGHIEADSTRLPLFNVSAAVAHVAGDAGAAGGSSLGGELSFLGSFAVGVSESRWAGLTRVYVPLAAALPLVTCADRRRFGMLFAVPTWSFEHVSVPTGSAWQSSWGAVNLGAVFELQSGLGFQAAVGGLFQHQTADPYRRVVVSAGVHFSPHGVLDVMKRGAEPARGGCAIGL